MRIDKAKVRDSFYQEDKAQTKQRVSAYTESYKGEYYNIEIGKLIPFKNQSRKRFDQKSLEELATTIKAHGIRQPLTILPSENNEGKYEIVSGERRWRAAILVGLFKVPCIILQDKNVAEEIALIENIQRKDLHPLELMHGFQNLLDKKVCKNHQEIADKVGVSRSSVVEILSLNKLPTFTQKTLLEKNIKSRNILRHLLKMPQDDHDKIINNEILKKKVVQKVDHKEKRKNLMSIYLQSEDIVFEEIKDWILTLEQKKQIKHYLEDLLARV